MSQNQEQPWRKGTAGKILFLHLVDADIGVCLKIIP